jgi:hypothetical protein
VQLARGSEAVKRALLGLLLVGCVWHTLPPPAGALDAGGLARVYKVADGLYRSPQPSEEQFKVLVAKYGIKTVVKLNSGFEDHDEIPNGVDLIHQPINVLDEVSPAYLQDILADIDRALQTGPVLVHCSHGEDRTGLLVALWRLKHQPMLAPEFAWNEMLAYGFHDGKVNRPGWPHLVAAFKAMTGWTP